MTIDFNDFIGKVDLYVEELEQISIKNNFKLVALFITNILTKSSYVLYNKSAEEIIKISFGLDNIYEGIEIEGI